MLSNRGFSLVELLIVIVIVLLVFAGVFKVFSKFYESEEQESITSIKRIEKIIGFEILKRDIRHAGFGIPKIKPALEVIDSKELVIRSSVANIDKEGILNIALLSYNDKSEIWEKKTMNGDLKNDLICVLLELSLDSDRVVSEYKSSCICDECDPLSLSLKREKTYILVPFASANYTLTQSYNSVKYYLKETSASSGCDVCKFSLIRKEENANGRKSSRSVMDCVCSFYVKFGVDRDGDNSIDSWSSNTTSDDENVKAVFVSVVYEEGYRYRSEKEDMADNLCLQIPGYSETICYSIPDKHYSYAVLLSTIDTMGIR